MLTTIITTLYTIQFRYREDHTQCLIFNNADGYVEGLGHVFRHPSDEPSRVVGEKCALTRALENSKLDRLERTEIWKKFHGHR